LAYAQAREAADGAGDPSWRLVRQLAPAIFTANAEHHECESADERDREERHCEKGDDDHLRLRC